MQTDTLGSLFGRHLAFPRGEGAEVAPESFVERIEGRIHRLAPKGHVDPEAWVEHFFEVEHSFEERVEELEAVAALGEQTVLEVDLGEMEYVVIEDHDEVVVVSQAGSLVMERTANVVSRIRAAQLPAAEQVRPGTRPSGSERAFHVTQAGAIASLDSRQVAALLKEVSLRVEPLARVRQARSRLAAFTPTERTRRIDAPGGPQPVAGTQAKAPRHQPQRAERAQVAEVARLADADRQEGTPRAMTVERGQVKTHAGPAMQRLAALALQGAGSGGARAVGRQTWAVKVGGVTALVQRPFEALGLRADGAARRMDSGLGRRTAAMAPALFRAPGRSDGFWIDPAAARSFSSGAAGRPGWVEQAQAQARGARERARMELGGHLDPVLPGPKHPAVGEMGEIPLAALAGRASGGERAVALPGALGLSASLRGAAMLTPAAVALAGRQAAARAASPATGLEPMDTAGLALAAPTYSVTDAEAVSYSGPGSWAGAMPATTLRALYHGLDRTLAYDGQRLRSVSVAFDHQTRTAPAAGGGEDLVASVRRLELETEPLAPSSVDAPEHSLARAFEAGRPGLVASGPPELSPLPARHEPVTDRAFTPRSTGAMLGLPFAAGSSVRIGHELEREISRLLEPRPLSAARVLPQERSPLGTRAGHPSPAAPEGALALSSASTGAAPSGAEALSAGQWLHWAENLGREVRTRRAGGAAAELGGLGSEGAASPRYPSPFVRFEEPAVQPEGGSGGVTPAECFASVVLRVEGELSVTTGAERALVEPAALAETAPPRAPATPLHRDVRPVPVSSTALSHDLNARRLPTSVSAASGGEEGAASEVVLVPVPLFVQMGESDAALTAATRSRSTGAAAYAPAGALHFAAPAAVGAHEAAHVVQAGSVPRRGELAASMIRRKGSGESIARLSDASLGAARRTPSGEGAARPLPSVPARALSQTAVPAASRGSISPTPAPQDNGTARTGPAPGGVGTGALEQAEQIQRSFGGHDLSAVHVHAASAATRPGAQAYAQGADLHFAAPAPSSGAHEAAHVVQQSGGVVRRKGKGEPVAAAARRAGTPSRGHLPSAGLGGAGDLPMNLAPQQPRAGGMQVASVERMVGGRLDALSDGRIEVDFGAVPCPRPPLASGGASRALEALSFGGADLALASPARGASDNAVAHEAAHVLQQGGRPRAKRKGSNVLRFEFPTEPQWWKSAGAAASGGAGAVALAATAPGAAVVVPGGVSAGGLASSGLTSGASSAVPEPSAARPVRPSVPARRPTSSGAALAATLVSGAGASAQNAFDGRTAYVAVGSDGQARVVPAGSAGAAAIDPRRSGSLDMTVVAAIPPQPPSLEEMAVAGRDRPHAKGKKEGEAKADSPKSDAMSLQGTVDSLAQRIYHRLKRRLQSDRERFGG